MANISAGNVFVVRGSAGVNRTNLTLSKPFYGILDGFVESIGYEAVPKISETPLEGLENAVYLIGHSLGSLAILKAYDPVRYPKIKGIILFDPPDQMSEHWNSWKVSKIAFVSWYGDDWWCRKQWDDTKYYRDGHYFSKSMEDVVEKMKKLISPGSV